MLIANETNHYHRHSSVDYSRDVIVQGGTVASSISMVKSREIY